MAPPPEQDVARVTPLSPNPALFRVATPALAVVTTLTILVAAAPARVLADGATDSAQATQTAQAAQTAEATKDAQATQTAQATQDATAAGAVAAALRSRIEVKGRVFARLDYMQSDLDLGGGAPTERRDLTPSVPSARAGLRARILDGMSLVLEADFAGRPSIKDGYLQAKSKRLMTRVGRFKMPISAFTLESPWNLPVARRGWLEELLSDHMLLTGRREGVVGGIEGGGYWDPAFTAGVFQSVRWGDLAGDPLTMRRPSDLTALGRLSVKPSGLELALVGQRRVAYAGREGEGILAPYRARGFWTVELDATGDFEFERTALRIWADAYVGSSWFDATNQTVDVTAEGTAVDTNRYVSGRGLVAFRWGGLSPGAGYLEAFAMAGVLEPDLSVTSDLFFEAMAGINLGHWRETRLTAQLEHGRTGRNFPAQFFRPFGDDVLTRFFALVFQAGAAF
jgi:hypothetical protein